MVGGQRGLGALKKSPPKRAFRMDAVLIYNTAKTAS
jgi:hypothetical protein